LKAFAERRINTSENDEEDRDRKHIDRHYRELVDNQVFLLGRFGEKRVIAVKAMGKRG
jgi:hypothetical protein